MPKCLKSTQVLALAIDNIELTNNNEMQCNGIIKTFCIYKYKYMSHGMRFPMAFTHNTFSTKISWAESYSF